MTRPQIGTPLTPEQWRAMHVASVRLEQEAQVRTMKFSMGDTQMTGRDVLEVLRRIGAAAHGRTSAYAQDDKNT